LENYRYIAHGRYKYKFVTVSLLKRLRNGLPASETAAKRNGHLDPEVVLNTHWNF
jgi:hypothetical protein